MADASLRERAIEAMARAIYEDRYAPHDNPQWVSWDDLVLLAKGDGGNAIYLTWIGHAAASLDALRTFLAANGLRVVPVEPEQPMWAAGGNAVVGYKSRHHDKVVEAVWGGMLAAYPDPFAPTEAEGE